MKFLGVDFGRKRIGLAVSDGTATLARPFRAVPVTGTPIQAAALVAGVIAEMGRQADEEFSDLSGVVVGLPRRLNGDDTSNTAPARAFAAELSRLTSLPVHLQDERLTSVEAEARLAERERDWRKRKPLIDAAAAAIILQDYLDAGGGKPKAAGVVQKAESGSDT